MYNYAIFTWTPTTKIKKKTLHLIMLSCESKTHFSLNSVSLAWPEFCINIPLLYHLILHVKEFVNGILLHVFFCNSFAFNL